MNGARCTSHSARKAVGSGFELPSFPFADSKTLRCARGFWRSGHSGRTKPPGGRWRKHHRRGRALTARAAPVVFACASDHLRSQQLHSVPLLGRLQTA